jgi:hypothetical protein
MSTDLTKTPAGTWGTSVVRTGVPVVAGYVVSWLVILLGQDLLDTDFQALLEHVLSIAGTLGWYALLRWAEPHLPAWLRVLAFGSTASVSYGPVEPVPVIDPLTGDVTDVYVLTKVPPARR